jgi:hypothetical protein
MKRAFELFFGHLFVENAEFSIPQVPAEGYIPALVTVEAVECIPAVSTVLQKC